MTNTGIDLKSRFTNKVFLLTFIPTTIAAIYQVLGVCGVVPTVSQDEIVTVAATVINVLAAVGVLINPNTPGISD